MIFLVVVVIMFTYSFNVTNVAPHEQLYLSLIFIVIFFVNTFFVNDLS